MKSKPVTRDAGTGKFVPTERAKTAPKSTVTDNVPVKHKPGPTRPVTRDAGSGQFVPPEKAKTAPKRTVTEQVPVKRKGK